jgi:hypothetical protein
VLEIPGPNQDSPKLRFVRFPDRQFALVGDFKFLFRSSNQAVTVPSGFVTDFASIPKIVAPIFKNDPHAIPGLVHDYLYWTQRCTRKQADRMFESALVQLHATNVKAGAMFLGVRIGGLGPWKQNHRERGDRLPRIIPDSAMNVHDGISWHDYRVELRDGALHVPVDDPGPEQPGYCKTGG